MGLSPKEQMEAVGYAVVPGVLERQEVAHLRRLGLDHFDGGGAVQGLGRYEGSLASLTSWVDTLVCHPGLVAAFRSVLGEGQLVFTGSADMHLNMFNIWHRDCAASGLHAWTGDFYRPGFEVCRAGIYLQAPGVDGQGLHVRPGSHKSGAAGLAADFVGTRAGDVLFIDSRLLHVGVLPDPAERLLRALGRWLGSPAPVIPAKDMLWRAKRRGTRLSMFVGYGLRNGGTEEFCRFDLRLRRLRSGADHCLSSPALLAALERAGVLSYETELASRFGDGVLREFAATGSLPEERIWQ